MAYKRFARLACALLAAGGVLGLAAGAAAATTITGAGSTLVAPLEAEWGSAWGQQTGNTVNYQSIGSGAGLTDIATGQVDFGASDAPLSASTTPCSGCVQIPWALGGVGISFNIPGVHRLHLSGPVIAKIYLGQITNWDNPQIKALNKGIARLPNLKITVFHRSDGSGTSYAFSDYMSSVSSAFAHRVGRATKPAFPVGPGANGNQGMTAAVKATRGAIAYIETAYLIANKLPAAAVKNRAGRWEVPNLRNISDAASIVKRLPANNELHIVNPPKKAKIAYPISTFTYVILRPTDVFGHGALVKQFVRFALGPGQAFSSRLDFVPLPKFIRQGDLRTLSKVH